MGNYLVVPAHVEGAVGSLDLQSQVPGDHLWQWGHGDLAAVVALPLFITSIPLFGGLGDSIHRSLRTKQDIIITRS